MLETVKIYLSTTSSDLNCPICYCTFGLESNQPISANCGHTICSLCFDKVQKCPFCKERFDKRRQNHKKSVFITSLLENSTKINTCKEHSEVCQGFCVQDKKFVCFDCVMKNHQGHKILTIKEINERAEKTKIVLQKARKKKEEKQLELKEALEAETQRQKRQFDEIIDQEISHLSMLKKKLYREADIRKISEEENYEHQLISENYSRQCENIGNLLGDWNKSQEVGLVARILESPSEEIQGVESFENQVELLKTEITRKQANVMNEILESLRSLSHSSSKFKKLFTPNKKVDPAQTFPDVELAYLIGVFKEYNLIVSQKNGFLELKIDKTIKFTPKFDPNELTCLMPKISLHCIEIIPSMNFATICQILQHIQALSEVTLHLQGLTGPDLGILFHFISNLKPLEKFYVQMNLTETERSAVSQFMNEVMHLKNLVIIDIQYKEPNTIISFQLVTSTTTRRSLEVLQEISLNLGGIPEVVCETLSTLNSHKTAAKSLEILRLSLGKTDYNLQVVEAVCQTLELQSDLKELTFNCEELNDAVDSDLLLFLSSVTQKKKLEICVNHISLRSGSMPTKILPKEHPDFEEFVLKIKYDYVRNVIERFEGLIDFLSTSKSLKKLCLQFDGVYSYFDHMEKLFFQIARIRSLNCLELEFIHLSRLHRDDQRDLEAILSELPASVTKKCVFKRSNLGSDFVEDDDEDDASENSEEGNLIYGGSDEEEDDYY